MAEKPSIPFLDLARQNLPIQEELLEAVARVAEAQNFVLGTAVRDFEAAIAEYIGVSHAVGVANGSDALYLAIRALNLQDGDEIITSPFTFFATAGAIENAGCRVVFADIDSRTFNLDAGAVSAAISDRTRAILAVHLYGQMADMAGLLRIAEDRGLAVIEDAAQSIGAKGLADGGWRSAGSIGDLGCFSFYPTKNLGGWGDGGLITTDDEQLAQKVRGLRIHGQNIGHNTYVHEEIGVNSRLDAIHAAVLHAKLSHLQSWTEARRVRAARYDQRLGGLDKLVTPTADDDRFHVYNIYTIRAQHRDELRAFLESRGVGTGLYYRLPLHLQPCFAHLGYKDGDFPEAERASREVLSLPLFPELMLEELDRVVGTIEDHGG